jgi:hypothetical protein
MYELATEIEIQITQELHEFLQFQKVDVTLEQLSLLVNELNPLKTYLEIICNKSFRKVIESSNKPFQDTNEEITRLFYLMLLDKFYDSQYELTAESLVALRDNYN